MSSGVHTSVVLFRHGCWIRGVDWRRIGSFGAGCRLGCRQSCDTPLSALGPCGAADDLWVPVTVP